MPSICIPPKAVDKFKQAFLSGDINPEKLTNMTSDERHKMFAEITDEENAKTINSLLESKLLLKNQQQGMITWAKNVAGLKDYARTDLLSKIGRMDKVLDPEDKQAFLKDLASTKLGVDVTQDEAKTIADLSKKVETARESMQSGGNRMEFGRAKVALGNYVNEIKIDAQKLNLTGHPVKVTGRIIKHLPGETKAINASMDNSAIFRQGWKTLWTHPGIWQKNARASFGNLVKQFGGKNVMDEVHADIVSRPNYDKYVRAKLAVGNLEEAFPTTAPEKIPILGRAYKASEAAYTAFVQKTRADVFDKYLEIAEKSGVDVADTTELKSIGKLVNSLTGRGSLGKLEPVGNAINSVFFSPRFLQSNIDTLTHPFGVEVRAGGLGGAGKITPFARKQAAINLLKIVSGVSAVAAIANTVKPGSVELDPRSSDFGKIRTGDTRFDITGGSGSIMTLAARLATRSSKSTTTGQISKLNSGKFGAQTGVDVINDFIENKLSPAAGIVRDLAQGQDANGNKATLGNEAQNAFFPMGAQNIKQMKDDPNHANILLTSIIDGLGISSNTYGVTKGNQSPWLTSTSKEIQQFKSKIGATQFKQAAKQYSNQLNNYVNNIRTNKAYLALPQSEQQTVITDEKARIQKNVFKQHGFRYKTSRSSTAQVKRFLK